MAKRSPLLSRLLGAETAGPFEQQLGTQKPPYSGNVQQFKQRDWSGLEIVEFNPRKMGGVATVRGRRISPDAFVDNYNGTTYTPEFIARELFEEPVEDVRTVLKYAEEKGWLSRPLL